jgi:hypothetical protein
LSDVSYLKFLFRQTGERGVERRRRQEGKRREKSLKEDVTIDGKRCVWEKWKRRSQVRDDTLEEESRCKGRQFCRVENMRRRE